MLNHLTSSVSVSRPAQVGSSPFGEVSERRGIVLSGVACYIGPGSGKLTVSRKTEQVVASHVMLTAGDEDIREGDRLKDERGRVYEVLLVTVVAPDGVYRHTHYQLVFRSGEEFP